MTTIGSALDAATRTLRASGSDTARLDAELLVGFAVGQDRTAVLAHPELPLGAEAAARLRSAVERRACGEPVAYIRGIKEFYGLVLSVDPRVMIPRPETELLVDRAVARTVAVLTGAPRPAGERRFRIADLACGSGAVAIAIASVLRTRGFLDAVEILATDVSADAVAVALENAVGHGLANAISLRVADLYPADAPPVDLLAANLPYIPSADLPGLPVAARFEPVLALDGGEDGLAVLRRLLIELPGVLAPGGTALLEIGERQVDGARGAAGELLPGWSVAVHADLAGRPRVVELSAMPQPAADPAADLGALALPQPRPRGRI
jgi:release factor glutamine methyltransferase